MFKNMFICVVFATLSIFSLSALADNNESSQDAISVLNAVNNTDNDIVLLPAADKRSDVDKNTTAEARFQTADKSELALPAGWLFVVALFWFMILSNRRSV